jgi:parvulin-like peptidyl-prolyl isomerase
MKSSVTLFLFAGTALSAWSQTAPNATPGSPAQKSAPASSPELKVRGPEAIAAKDPSRIVGTINGKQVTAKQAADLLKLIPESQRKSAPNLQTLFERLYLVNDLAEQATKQGLDQQSPVKEQIKLDRDNILAQAYMSKLAASSAGSGDPKSYFDSHQDEFDIAKLSGIVVAFNPPGTPASAGGVSRTEQQAHDKADDIEKKIKAGADIATLARTESDNQASAAKGGDLGALSLGAPNVPADLKTVVFNKLQPGQVSEPIRTGNAFYVIKLESRAKETFEQARPQIEQKLQSDKNNAAVKQELDKYKVTSADPDFFATASASTIPSLSKPAHTVPATASSGSPKQGNQ